METFEEYCKDFIVDNLDAYVGTDVYGCDLSSTLTEEINVNGSATFSRQKARIISKSGLMKLLKCMIIRWKIMVRYLRIPLKILKHGWFV